MLPLSMSLWLLKTKAKSIISPLYIVAYDGAHAAPCDISIWDLKERMTLLENALVGTG